MQKQPSASERSSSTAPGPVVRRQWFWGLPVAALLVLLFSVNPETTSIFPKCPFFALTNWYCPGCGSLRATHHLLNGRIIEALTFNPLYVAALPLLAYAFAAGSRLPRRTPSRPLPAIWIYLLLILILAYWVVRNLPVYPWTWLAPG